MLAILCGLMVLFAGGCALLAAVSLGLPHNIGATPLVLIPGAIAALNVLVLVALFGTRQPHRWAFYVLAGLDAVLVAVLGLLWLGYGLRDPGTNLFGGLIVGAFALKAALTVAAARRL